MTRVVDCDWLKVFEGGAFVLYVYIRPERGHKPQFIKTDRL